MTQSVINQRHHYQDGEKQGSHHTPAPFFDEDVTEAYAALLCMTSKQRVSVAASRVAMKSDQLLGSQLCMPPCRHAAHEESPWCLDVQGREHGRLSMHCSRRTSTTAN